MRHGQARARRNAQDAYTWIVAPDPCMPRCSPKPETLKRKEEEAAALRNSRKGLRGAARVAAGRPSAPAKGGSKTVYGPPKPRCVFLHSCFVCY